MNTVIVYGPQASGKTRNAGALRVLYGCEGINDEGKSNGEFHVREGYLNIMIEPPMNPPSNILVVHINEAIAELAQQRSIEAKAFYQTTLI
ncbi:MAG: isopentenyl transferase-like protein [Podoviridae sp. ctpVR23]|nr:MAG: isopentenyl transferase-like protein [Podoviridae sp. ctpVR23]